MYKATINTTKEKPTIKTQINKHKQTNNTNKRNKRIINTINYTYTSIIKYVFNPIHSQSIPIPKPKQNNNRKSPLNAKLG